MLRVAEVFKVTDCKRSKADPGMYYFWNIYDILIWLLWIYGCLYLGHPKSVENSRDKMKSLSYCDDVGNMEEYVGYKIDCENR